MKLLSFLVGLTAVFVFSSCASNPVPEGTLDATQHSIVTEEYRIGVDDVVDVNVWGNEQLSVQVPVRPDGRITIPLLGDVEVAGKTAEEVAAIITEGLKKDIRSPSVTVTMASLQSKEYLRRVRVTGAVANPVSLNYRQGMTVLDAILEAGGLGEFASGNKAVLIRRHDGKTVSVPLRLEDMLVRGVVKGNHVLIPGDIITVPERFF
jgi:polysaccharide export outer membrane protein